jgi:hypothetical protein
VGDETKQPGEHGGPCFRTACRTPDAICRHTQTGRYYCLRCAMAINENNFAGLVEIPRTELLMKRIERRLEAAVKERTPMKRDDERDDDGSDLGDRWDGQN